MANRTVGRVVFPNSPGGWLTLAVDVYKKHLEEGSNSPLLQVDDQKWDIVGPNSSIALAKHEEAEAYKRKMEECYRERDKYLTEIVDHTRTGGRFLKAKYNKNPKKMGDWGYTVDDTPPSRK